MPQTVFRLRNRQGYSLLEVLVTLSIFLIILYSVYMVYDTQRTSYSRTEARIDTQDNARMALSTLERELRMAGYGVPAALGPSVPRIVEARPRSITFRADLRGVITTLIASAASGSGTLYVNSTTGIAAGDVIYLTDHAKARALTVQSVNASASTVTTTTLTASFPSGSRLYVPRDILFTIASGELRRYQRVPGGSWSTYTVLAGLLQDADCFRYYDATNTEITANNPVTNPDATVRRIRIQLTASSTPAGLDPQSYTLRCDARLRNL
ncbi:MAG: prepilin-type N-terminal cleavage/methylation domain-containing protein [candidate division NC10 bacterium]|nr:prepilin-type N-terminal cleavage/methylation domain-containing protein [candidate division NC10 bacterium]